MGCKEKWFVGEKGYVEKDNEFEFMWDIWVEVFVG